METVRAQAEEIKGLKTMVADNVRQPSYSEAGTGHETMDSAAGRTMQTNKTRSAVTRHGSPRVRDERAVPIDLGRYKDAKNNFNAIKENLQISLKVNNVIDREVNNQMFAARTWI